MDINSPTTVEEWTALHEKFKQATSLNPSPTQKISLRFCASVTLVSGILYALSILKRQSAGMWIFRKDSEGYWHPNIHTALPIFAVLYVVVDVCAVWFLEKSAGHVIDPVPIVLQMLAVQALQVVGWLKTWVVLYALPSLQHRLQANKTSITRTTRARNLVSPGVFNALNILTIIAVPAGQVPWMAFIYLSIKKCGIQIFQTDLSFQEVLNVSASDDSSLIFQSALKAFLGIAGIKREETRALAFIHKYVIANVTITCFITAVFCISSSLLLYSLRAQKKFLKSALANRKALQLIEEQEWNKNYSHSITSWIIESPPATPVRSEQGESETSYQLGSDFNPWNWKSWMHFANYEVPDTDVSWKLVDQLKKPKYPRPSSLDETHSNISSHLGSSSDDDGIAELENHCKFLTIYWYSTLWQTVLGMGMLFSFTALQFWLVSRRTSAQESVMTAFTWMNWTWGGGAGLLLGIISSVVTYSLPRQLPKNSNPDQSANSYVKARTLKANATSPTTSRDKFQEKKSIKVMGIPSNRGLVQSNRSDDGPTSMIKMADFSGDWSISNLGLSRSSSKTSATLQNNCDLSRKDSASSTYSSYQGHTADPSRQGETKWNGTDNMEKEYLDTDQCDGGHFNAIHALRRGTFRDTQFNRRS